MVEKKKVQDIELTKILLDPRRRSILDQARGEPVTVSQIADALGEKPSRLYYHVKKLEDAGLLELVETKQQGNLIEKYYMSSTQDSFELDELFMKEHSEEVMKLIRDVISPGLKIIEGQMKNRGEYNKPTEMNIAYKKQTIKGWLETMDNIMHHMKGNEAGVDAKQIEEELKKYNPEELEQKSNYAYVILSYRLEDVEEYGGEVPEQVKEALESQNLD